MNIFILENDIKNNAISHCDKHVVKMILEYSQLLCSALHISEQHREILNISINEIPYKLTHKNHPCAIWVRKNIINYSYLSKLFKELCCEYTYRYNKKHASQDKINPLLFILNDNLDINDLDLPKCMPEYYKSNSIIESYRNYYNNDKKHLHNWKNRDIPSWITL